MTVEATPLRLAYADPPYLGCCGLYDHFHGDGGCWDDIDTHAQLITRLNTEFDGWAMSATSTSLHLITPLAPTARIAAWVKPFAAFKRNVPVAYAWEPVLVKEARKPIVGGFVVMRDFMVEPITMRRGLSGAKPEKVCHWLFEVVGAQPGDELDDMYPGSGAVTRAWRTWLTTRPLPFEEPA
jgi:hypothetical protein